MERGRVGEKQANDNLQYAISDERYAVAREDRALYDARAEAWRNVLREISDADIANMTPVQALVLLNELQRQIAALEGAANL